MLKKIEYNSQKERQSIIDQNRDSYLVEEQNIIEGNFLIFSDTLPTVEVYVPMITIPQSEYENLQNQLLLKENKEVGGIL